jgi:hypothetical protein
MGEVLALATGQPVRVTVDVTRGAGLILRLVSATGVVYDSVVRQEQETFTVELQASIYVRAELVGDMAPERLPAYAPPGLELRQWRWALTNPIYLG